MARLALPCFERNMLFQVLRGSRRPVLVEPGAPEADLGSYAPLLARTMRGLSRFSPLPPRKAARGERPGGVWERDRFATLAPPDLLLTANRARLLFGQVLVPPDYPP